MTAAALGVLSGPRRFAAVRAWRAQRGAGVVRAAAAPNRLGVVRVGYAISGVKTAVLRNRLRRRLRAAARDVLIAHPGMDFIISAGPNSAVVAYAKLSHDVTTAVAAVADVVTQRLSEPTREGR